MNNAHMASFARASEERLLGLVDGAADLARQVQPWLWFTRVARMGRHMGNAGCNRTGRACAEHLARFLHMTTVLRRREAAIEVGPVHRDFEVVMFGLPLRWVTASSRAWFRRGLVRATRNVKSNYEDHCYAPEQRSPPHGSQADK